MVEVSVEGRGEVGKLGRSELRDHGTTQLPSEEKDRARSLRLLHERRVAQRSRAYRTYLRKFFKGQENRVIANLEQFFPRVEGAISGMAIRKVREWLKQNQSTIDRINFRLEEANKDLDQGSTPFLQAALVSGGEEALAQVGTVEISFDLTNPRVVEWLGEKTSLIRDINRVTHEAIDQALRAGFEGGEPMRQIAERIGQVFEQADGVRSLRIAQTQMNSAANTGTLEGYAQSGVVEAKEWIAGPDARPTHQAAAAKYSGDGAIPVGQDFVVGAGRGPCPGRIGRPEEDINCRCTIVPVLRRTRRAEEGTHEVGKLGSSELRDHGTAQLPNVFNITLPEMRPEISVAAPVVNVAPAEVKVAAPQVHVHPPDVTVNAPEVHVNVESPKGKRKVVFTRDDSGEMVSADVSEE